MMTREVFLTQFWNPYPSAEVHWLDVAQLVRGQNAEAIVAGRLMVDGRAEMRVVSAGSELRFQFSESVSWIKPQKKECDFHSDLFRSGDLVALQLKGRPLQRDSIVSGVLLLAPTRENWSLRSRFTIERSREWNQFIAAIREYFERGDFIEALTPTLVPSPGTEAFLDPFVTDWEIGSFRAELFLPTSPEFHLKKMLSAGWTRVFEFKSCFRNGEIGSHHQPEFTMLEWYRAYSNLDAIADDVESLFVCLSEKFPEKTRARNFTTKRTTMARLFADQFNGFLLRPDTTREELLELADRHGVDTQFDDSWDDVFFRLFLEKIEPDLGFDGPLLVRGYPPSQAALSRIGVDGFADRFEVYWEGLEIANAFHELNDPDENERRFKGDSLRKRELSKRAVPVDEDLVKALRFALPPSGGVALGVDRLFMALFGIDEIADARAFPAKRP